MALLGTLFWLGWLVCHVLVLIHAFKNSLVWGLLCLCVPCVSLFYLFFKFEHENKTLIVIGYLFGGIVASSLHGYHFSDTWGPHLGIGKHPQQQHH
jgi:hypothetical protein